MQGGGRRSMKFETMGEIVFVVEDISYAAAEVRL